MATHSNIPGITKISFLKCSSLQSNIEWKSMAGIPVGIAAEQKEVPFSGIPTCEAVTDYNKNDETQKTTLKFKSVCDIPTDTPLAFIVTDAHRKSYLIGVKEKPYPIIKKEETTGTPDGDSSVISYEITRTSLKSLISVAN